MANVDSTTLNKNVYMQAFGNSVILDGTLALAANPTAADVLRIMRIPAGTTVSMLVIANTDMDTGTPDFVVSIGYAPVDSTDGPTADADYFAAAGTAILGTANLGTVYAQFAPITFDKDVYLTMTVGTDAATFAAGTIYAQAIGIARGVK